MRTATCRHRRSQETRKAAVIRSTGCSRPPRTTRGRWPFMDAFDRSDHLVTTRRRFLRTIGGVAAVVTGMAGQFPSAVARDKDGTPPAMRFDAEVPTAWFDLALRLIRTT